MEEPEFLNCAQERVFGYLWEYVGNLSINETRIFLRFVIGSSVLSSSAIKVMFNSVSGLARCPVAHTCDNSIVKYATFDDFSKEIKAVLYS